MGLRSRTAAWLSRASIRGFKRTSRTATTVLSVTYNCMRAPTRLGAGPDNTNRRRPIRLGAQRRNIGPRAVRQVTRSGRWLMTRDDVSWAPLNCRRVLDILREEVEENDGTADVNSRLSLAV